MTALSNKYDFLYYFDVQDGNPNGDPDAGNLPRIDPETGHGIVTDVCLKRKLRNYVLLAKGGKEGFDVFVKEKAVLNTLIDEAFEAPSVKKLGELKEQEDAAREELCRRFFDIRAFGAVLSTGGGKAGEDDDDSGGRQGDAKKKRTSGRKRNAGQVRGPVQLTFGRSVDPIVSLEHTITRVAITREDDAARKTTEMGRKATVPYALYGSRGFVSANLATFSRNPTRFSQEDLELLWDGFARMFEEDRSAARGLMSARALFIFRHESKLGDAPAHALFDRVRASRRNAEQPARGFQDYELVVQDGDLPRGVTLDARLF